jgi:glycosyl-4,4'-diaponeurosporenoate acyltransferase
MQSGKEVLSAELARLEWETRRNEIIHLLAMLFIGGILVIRSPQLSLGQVAAIFAINLYVNVYPIFLQRHNRIRIMRAIRRCEPQGPACGI